MAPITSIKLPLDMSIGDTTNLSTWSGTQDQGLGQTHACTVMSVEESDDASQTLPRNAHYFLHSGPATHVQR